MIEIGNGDMAFQYFGSRIEGNIDVVIGFLLPWRLFPDLGPQRAGSEKNTQQG